jgi:predicted RNA-binding protein with RPS1 domain
MVFWLGIVRLRLAEQAVVNALDPLAYPSPIKIVNDSCACVYSQALRQLAILQQCNDSFAKRLAIIDVRNYGLMVELPDALVTGLVHVSSLIDDFYLFDPGRRQLIGRRSRKRFSVGDELSVFVVRVDAFKRQVDFAITPASSTPRKARRNKGKSRSI